MSEVILAASSCRTTVTERYQTSVNTQVSGSWGCEDAAPTSPLINAIETGADGSIRVTIESDNFADLAADDFIYLQPLDAAGAALDAAAGAVGSDLGTAVSQWRCGALAASAALLTLLPGSCSFGYAAAPEAAYN